jgi:hypothetical protein
MTKQIPMLALFLFSMAAFGQRNEYLNTMISTMESMDKASSKEDFLKCAAQFERIASAEESKWLPYYYGANSLIILSFDIANVDEKDLILDRAQQMLDHAFQLEPNESELFALQSFLYPSRIMVDPMGRGMLYMEKMFTSLETAKALNPENPRVYFLEGVNKANMPSSMGGGPEAAKPILEMADAKFKSFKNEDPLWPRWGEEANLAELNKLQ